jgi:glycosyltransferase involved in cell wall biosynthesis
MNIGISTAFLGNLRAGTWQYTRHLLQGAVQRGIMAVDRETRALGVDGLALRSYPGGGGKLAKLLWPNFILPSRAARDGFDLIHCTTPYGTFMPCRYRNVITVCDVTPLLFPGTHGRLNVGHFRFALPAILRRADRIITISHCSKRDIVRLYGLPEEKVIVTMLAADPCFRPLPKGGGGGLVQALPRPYILNVGTLEPRKNLEGLLHAFARAKRAGIPHTLVIAGARGWGDSRLAPLPEALGITDSVVFTGFVEDDDLPHLYGNADFFVYPSLYEGFGLPVLEAMACGTPVITANTSSIPEVAGDAALLVDPRSETDLAAAMVRLAGDGDLRGDLGLRGLSQAARFSWERTVGETLAVYDALLG